MPKDIQLTVIPAQALAKIREDAARKVADANHAAELAGNTAQTAIALAEQRARDAEDQLGAVTEGQRAAMRRVTNQIRYSPALYPWMRAYAEWLTLECVELPKVSARTGRARKLSCAPLNIQQLKQLEARADFVAYVNDLQAGPLERARRRFEAAFPEYVDAHRDALAQARDANDYNAIARIAEPVLDRVMPKKAENVAAAQVTVMLAPEQMKAIATYEAPKMLVTSTTTEE